MREKGNARKRGKTWRQTLTPQGLPGTRGLDSSLLKEEGLGGLAVRKRENNPGWQEERH